MGEEGVVWLSWMELPDALAAPRAVGKRDSVLVDAGAVRREEGDCIDESSWEQGRRQQR